MKKRIIKFVTGNNGKFEEVAHWLRELDPSVTIEQVPIDLPEIQSLDVKKVGIEKVNLAWQHLKQPLLIDDGGIYFTRYKNFPGPLSKYVYEGIGLEGLWHLAKEDPRAFFMSVFIYKDSADTHQIFEGKCYGTFIDPVSVEVGHSQLPFTKIFVPEGSTKTFAQLRGTPEEKKYHHRYHSLKNFLAWLHKNK